ncbi:unnamed protein product [Hermetia illucens]|uniref:Vps72/YL1 N-terminal domain-containing protein n=1 Tax=Hermetia illucens TaxID=343691 RepID=A0A7R8V0C8_HERIL|nr:unnamed protein product [Hermetia illucens]
MASTRSRRANAGNKIAKLLDEEEEDDFYKTSYGGFQEVDDDVDYVQKDEEEDIVDSDFSIDEDDEPISENEEEQPKRAKKPTRGYKDPKAKKPAAKTTAPAIAKAQAKVEKKVKRKPKPRFTVIDTGRKSIRASTALKSAATRHRLKELNEARKKKKKLPKAEEYIPTQEELLEEAAITEEENIKSLEKFQKLELEKKKNPSNKTSIHRTDYQIPFDGNADCR